MQISVRWLKEWVDIGPDAFLLAEDLTMAGLEVSAVTEVNPLSPKIVVGKINFHDLLQIKKKHKKTHLIMSEF